MREKSLPPSHLDAVESRIGLGRVLTKLVRYESMIDAEFRRALTLLERLQRTRIGDVVLPSVTVDVNVDTAGDSGEDAAAPTGGGKE